MARSAAARTPPPLLAPPPQASLGVVEGRCQLRPPAAFAAGTAGAGDLCDVGHSRTPDAARIAVSRGRPLGPARWPALRAEASLEKKHVVVWLVCAGGWERRRGGVLSRDPCHHIKAWFLPRFVGIDQLRVATVELHPHVNVLTV